MDVRGKNAILTGGARLGISVTTMLAMAGVNLLLSYRYSKQIAEKTAEDAKRYGVKAFTFRADISRAKEVKKLFEFAKKKLGRIDIVIVMASSFALTPFETLNEKIFDRELANTLKTAFLCGKIGSDAMRRGKIIFIGDARIEKNIPPPKGRLPYYIAKAGVHALTRLLAHELAPRIQVNCVAPGLVLPREKTKEMLLKRSGTPEDVGKAILSLLKNDRVTGIVK